MAGGTAVMWTNTSLLPSCGMMKPKPLVALNHLTVPVAIDSVLLEEACGRAPEREGAAYANFRLVAAALPRSMTTSKLTAWPSSSPRNPAA